MYNAETPRFGVANTETPMDLAFWTLCAKLRATRRPARSGSLRYNDAHHYRAENPLSHLHEDEAPVR